MAPDTNENGLPDVVDKLIAGILLAADAGLAAFMAATATAYDWAPWVYGLKAALPVVAGYFAIKGRP